MMTTPRPSETTARLGGQSAWCRRHKPSKLIILQMTGGAQGPEVAERLSYLFVGNERRHVKSSGLPVFDNAKNKWTLTSTTHDGPATVDHWQQHLDHKFILSIIPLLDNGTCWFACIDADEYEIDYVEICERIDRLKLPLIAVVSKSAACIYSYSLKSRFLQS